jgi:MFS family permease
MPRLTPLQWLICAIAALGFAFDIYEVLMAPLVVGPAIGELTGFKPGTPDFNFWVGMFFWVPAIVGGVFGLLGGYLTDRFGRRRVLVWSILLYAFSAMAAGFSTSITMLLVLRSTTYIGVFVEFVAAVAWIAELFEDPKQREAALGYTQAFSSIGGLLVTGAYAIAVTYAQSFPEIAGGHSPWRYTLISGVIPALPLIIIRPFLPESPAWHAKKAAGTLKRPSLAAIFTPELRRTTIVTTIMFAYGAPCAASRCPHCPGPECERWHHRSSGEYRGRAGVSGVGGLVDASRWRSSRSRRLAAKGDPPIQVPGLVIVPLVFFYAVSNSSRSRSGHSGGLLHWRGSVSGEPTCRASATARQSEGFAANIGGRMLGTGFAFVTTQLVNVMPGSTPPMRLAYASAAVVTFVYALGLVCSALLPEPKGQELPE